MSTVASVVLWILICFFVGVGCAGAKEEDRRIDGTQSCDRTFLVSSDFPPDERAALQRAASRWNEIAIEQFCLQVTDEEIDGEDSRAIFRIPYKGEYWQKVSASMGGVDFIGIYWGWDLIGIVDSMPIDQFERVALHEFGHAHGLGHTEAPSIMHAYDGTASDFTANDIAECKRVGACASDVAASSSKEERPAVWVLQ
jgi:hypothetical protein